MDGNGVTKDETHALQLFQLAAEGGNARAFANLANALAAEGGNARAFANLANIHYKGVGLPKDAVVSYMWLECAKRTGEAVDDALRKVGNGLNQTQIAEAKNRADLWMATHGTAYSTHSLDLK